VAKANAMKANLPMKKMKKMPAMKTKKALGCDDKKSWHS
jgi:hypothetical protein